MNKKPFPQSEEKSINHKKLKGFLKINGSLL
jgi:hypothetical protein